jgi:transposase
MMRAAACSPDAAIADLFWLSGAQWAVIEPYMPRDQPGSARKDDR